MRIKAFSAVALGCALAAMLLDSATAGAPTAEVKAKPPLYTYVSSFAFPRGKWADVEKQNASEQKNFDKALSEGGLVGYGEDTALVHTSDGFTHDTFWSAMSLAAVVNVLEAAMKGGATTTPAFASATKHEDGLFVSRYYNWKSGAFKGGYTHEAAYKMKDSAPEDALDTICKSFGVPLFEKLLADGTILEYEIDEEQIHTEEPGRFWIIYITKNAEGLDKVNAAIDAGFGASPLIGPALDTFVETGKHHDHLARTDGAYK
jgi:hypothetical protein